MPGGGFGPTVIGIAVPLMQSLPAACEPSVNPIYETGKDLPSATAAIFAHETGPSMT